MEHKNYCEVLQAEKGWSCTRNPICQCKEYSIYNSENCTQESLKYILLELYNFIEKKSYTEINDWTVEMAKIYNKLARLVK